MSKKVGVGRQGVVAAGSEQSAEAGAAILRLGGNAVDAAVATAFMSFFAEISLVQWGGSGVAMLYDSKRKQGTFYDFFSNMPGLGRDGMPDNLDFAPVSIQFSGASQDFLVGRGAVAVPGNIFGLCQLSAEHGTLPLKTILQPAIEAAKNGTTMSAFQAELCGLLSEIFTHSASMRRIFAPDGRLLSEGDRLFIPDLHETLLALADEGAGLLRTGSLGQAFCHDQATRGGLIGQKDLTEYEVGVGEPLQMVYRGYDLLLPPPSSIGGLLIGFTLKLMARFDVAAMGLNSAENYQLFFETMQATARARHLLDEAIRDDTLAAVADSFLQDDLIDRYVAQVMQALETRTPTSAAPPAPSHSNTSHISVVDTDGMAVSLTTTSGESAGYVTPGTGFIANNMLGEADLNPHGWHQWRAGQRMPTMMTPLLLMKDGRVVLAAGSGGSERIRSALVQVIGGIVDYGLAAQVAVDKPRLHVERDVLQCEAGFDEAAVAQMEAWGYAVNRWERKSMYFGGANCVGVSAENQLTGSADARRGGHSVSVTRT